MYKETDYGIELRKYTHPDFAEQKFIDSPDCRLEEAPKDGVVPFDSTH